MDQSSFLKQAIESAVAAKQSLSFTGEGSKTKWLPSVSENMLSTLEHRGIVSYDPSELVITVRAGMPIRELNMELAQHQQKLASDPPQYFGQGTVGGAISAGFSGPGRPWQGALRDAVLGIELINGNAQVLRFGGQVMKNVAGYDVSRLATGAFGCLGLILSASLRVHPAAEHEQTFAFDFSADRAVEYCRSIARMPLPLSATCWVAGVLYIRLSGTEVALQAAQTKLGGELVLGDQLWAQVRDHQHSFFKPAAIDHEKPTGAKLWRLIVPPASVTPNVDEDALLIEWGGGLRWMWHNDDEFVAQYMRETGGWAWAMGEPVRLGKEERKYMSALKLAFDPHDLFSSPLKFEGDG
ncbi:MAG: glycolate oxidase subunit GlcE [Gammaproteobacteria bacterium]|nr:glycolate oxidase subunit GlcE [Gammaproteobacteria bacterium]